MGLLLIQISDAGVKTCEPNERSLGEPRIFRAPIKLNFIFDAAAYAFGPPRGTSAARNLKRAWELLRQTGNLVPKKTKNNIRIVGWTGGSSPRFYRSNT
jgi:hypothetical protein